MAKLKLPEGEKTNLVAQVDISFYQKCLADAWPQYRGNISDWLRDLAAQKLGYISFAEYVQSVSHNEQEVADIKP